MEKLLSQASSTNINTIDSQKNTEGVQNISTNGNQNNRKNENINKKELLRKELTSQQLEIYEKSKFKKSLICKICGKSYTQNSGIFHHLKDKHGEFKQEYIDQIYPQQEKVKRGRPKIKSPIKEQQVEFNLNNEKSKEIEQEKKKQVLKNIKNENKQNSNNSLEALIQKIKDEQEEGDFFEDLDLDFLQNDHIKMVLSLIIEYGEPNKQRKYNILYNQYDDMYPFQVEQNKLNYEDWPELMEQYNKIDNNLILAQQNLQIANKSDNQDIKTLTFEKFINYFVNCALGYIYDKKIYKEIAEYFGN
ncbi:hypothetical protein PPERSA_02821 [Pseudocohnilembus persalinus]|uniref:C2H2-type domain-containing protein n=1 Tax=Pseudocohnilembus persalinus TaxID=266149 RepID=A0A0V0QMG4_PSEPJ|nr:hypothetical protein PPERSA_02821 [Pseudocohnilembus persalinus]|eukprot:KRX03442.1 hypothetical protein PPERSA_02821 [Pseudocohnilembus persalinus]